MQPQTRMVKVNLLDIIKELSKLPTQYRKTQENNICDMHYQEVPSWYPRPYLEIARDAIDRLSTLPPAHHIRKRYDLNTVIEGYNLIEAGKVIVLKI